MSAAQLQAVAGQPATLRSNFNRNEFSTADVFQNINYAPELQKEKPAQEQKRAKARAFEQTYQKNEQSQIRSQALRDFLLVPPGDSTVHKEERKFRTLQCTVPVSGFSFY
jgi:hypothetical protein